MSNSQNQQTQPNIYQSPPIYNPYCTLGPMPQDYRFGMYPSSVMNQQDYQVVGGIRQAANIPYTYAGNNFKNKQPQTLQYAVGAPYTTYQGYTTLLYANHPQNIEIDPYAAVFPIPKPMPVKDENNLPMAGFYSSGVDFYQQPQNQGYQYRKNNYQGRQNKQKSQQPKSSNNQNQLQQEGAQGKKKKKKQKDTKDQNMAQVEQMQKGQEDEQKVKSKHFLQLNQNDIESLADQIFQTHEQKEDVREKKRITMAKQQTLQKFDYPSKQESQWNNNTQKVNHQQFNNYSDEEEAEETKQPEQKQKNLDFNPWDFPLEIGAANKAKKKKQQKPKIQPKVYEESKNDDKIIVEESKEPKEIKNTDKKMKETKENSKQEPMTNPSDMHELIEGSEYYQMWKSIPKKQRERLTKKQMMRVMKPDILAEGIQVQVLDQKTTQRSKKQIEAQQEENAAEGQNENEKVNMEEVKQPLKNKKNKMKAQDLDSINDSQMKTNAVNTSTANQSYTNKRYQLQSQQQQQFQSQFNNKTKTKPKKIVVEERDENNEIVRHIIEKSRKKKISALKKAILKKRDRETMKKEQRQLKEQKSPKKALDQDDLSSGYVTIDENNPEPTQLLHEQVSFKKNFEYNMIAKQTRGFPYTPIFSDLEDICQKVEEQLIKGTSKPESEPTNQQYVKMTVTEDDNIGNKISLHPKKNTREYVDIIQSNEMESMIFGLIQKLKKLYYNRKINPNKKGKPNRNIKKRYIVGMKEVIKNLDAEKIKMIILAVNLEKVDGEKGLDEMVEHIIQTCKEQKVPLVYALTRYKLGFVSKYQGQMASIVGIMNFQGANDEFNYLVSKVKEQREEFYRQLAKNLNDYELILLRKENRFLDWQLLEKIKSDPLTYFQ